MDSRWACSLLRSSVAVKEPEAASSRRACLANCAHLMHLIQPGDLFNAILRRRLLHTLLIWQAQYTTCWYVPNGVVQANWKIIELQGGPGAG